MSGPSSVCRQDVGMQSLVRVESKPYYISLQVSLNIKFFSDFYSFVFPYFYEAINVKNRNAYRLYEAIE
jgi:hypothetical protein